MVADLIYTNGLLLALYLAFLAQFCPIDKTGKALLWVLSIGLYLTIQTLNLVHYFRGF